MTPDRLLILQRVTHSESDIYIHSLYTGSKTDLNNDQDLAGVSKSSITQHRSTAPQTAAQWRTSEKQFEQNLSITTFMMVAFTLQLKSL